MLEQGDLRLELMSSKAAAEYLGENDLAVLPIGCIEMHGPHVPLGCDLMIAWGTSVLLARKWGAVLMPPISYAYPGASGPWPGTVNVRPEATITWIKEVALSIVRGGFKRLVLCAVHAPLNWMLQVVVRSLYQEHGVIVAAFSPYGRVTQRIKAEFGRGGEDAYVLGALRILGLHGAFRPETDVELIADRSGEASVALGEARVSVPWLFSAPHHHVAVRSDLKLDDADLIAGAIEKAVDEMEDIPELFARHQAELEALACEQPWNKDDVWSG